MKYFDQLNQMTKDGTTGMLRWSKTSLEAIDWTDNRKTKVGCLLLENQEQILTSSVFIKRHK